jgi:hypothetical protein
VQTWKASPEFRERMGRVQEFVDEFRPSELDLVAWATRGVPTTQRA